jgi:L-serine dehydratase
MTERSSIFDMIGPVMIGPSSSHTAGVARIGRVTRLILGQEPTDVTVTFFNSFATTYEGHGSDRAVIAGLLGFSPDDRRLRDALHIAAQKGINIRWRALNSAPKLHPNTLLIEARAGDRTVSVMGVSRGGGLITIVEIDGFHANIVGQSYLLLILAEDIPGSIALITTPIAVSYTHLTLPTKA